MNDVLKPGDYLYIGWGATMRGYHFYQVVKIDKSKIYLSTPKTESTGSHEGKIWITGPDEAQVVTHYAKFIRGKIKLCTPDFKVQNSYWNTASACELYKKFYYYGD